AKSAWTRNCATRVTSDAVRRLLVVVVGPHSLSSFLDNLFNLVQVPIEKVHFSHWSLDPCASVHLQSPLVRSRDNRDRSDCAETLNDRSYLSHRKRGCLAIVMPMSMSDIPGGRKLRAAQGRFAPDYSSNVSA